MVDVVLYFTNTPSQTHPAVPAPEEIVMNVRTFEARRNESAKSVPVVPAAPARQQYRERDFGVGYGTSSGYASHRRYSNSSFQPLFRCA